MLLQENAKYGKFWYYGLKFCDELELIFGETVATSEDAWTPTMGVPHESSGRNITSNVTHEIIEFDSKKVYLDYDVYPCGKIPNHKEKKNITR